MFKTLWQDYHTYALNDEAKGVMEDTSGVQNFVIKSYVRPSFCLRSGVFSRRNSRKGACIEGYLTLAAIIPTCVSFQSSCRS